MSRFVLDASVTMSWCFEDGKTDGGEAALDALGSDGSALAPVLWTYEVLNVLARARKRKRLTSAHAAAFWNDLRRLPVEIDGGVDNDVAVEILALAGLYGLTAYDAAYLELAMREGLPLATLDEDLRRAAKAAGVKLAFQGG